MASFRARNGLECPRGCGTCCEGFVPDVLPVEASYLAAWLVRNRPDRALEIAQADSPAPIGPGCPLYDPASPETHCTVYPGRPLICRLFGFSGTRSRTGLPSFSLCRLMPGLPPPRSGARVWEGERLAALFGLPPLMSDISAELAGISPGDASRRESLPDALPAALRQVLFLAGLGSGRDPETDGDDPVFPPLDRVS